MGKIVALVPARSGSTRVKHKNLQQINGIPLLGLAIRQALMVEAIHEVYVSTDSGVYANTAANYGAKVPFIRPNDLASTESTDYEVFRHFLEWYVKEYKELPELIVQVRPTAPVREPETIKKAINFMLEHQEFDSLRSISDPHQSPYKMWKIKKTMELQPVIDLNNDEYDKPTQELPQVYAQDGIVDIVRPQTLLTYHSMAGEKVAGWIDHPITWDIDVEADFRVAENLLKKYDLFKMMKKPEAFGGNLGIVQGRLTVSDKLQNFPNHQWEEEFSLARKAGYTAIEWIRDSVENKENPFWDEGFDIQEVKQKAMINGVSIRSICDDYVQNCDWEHLTIEQYQILEDLLIKAGKIGIQTVVYPLFLLADIANEAKRQAFMVYLRSLARVAESYRIQIALEISQKADKLLKLFQEINFPNVGLCVDTGNLYAAGISISEIFKNQDLSSRIIHVHLKDRNKLGENVVIGKGEIDFGLVGKHLQSIGYNGLLIMETNRGDNPIKTAIHNKEWMRDRFFEYMGGKRE